MFHARLVPIQSRSIRDFFFVHPTYTHRITISDNTLVFSLRFLVADRKRFLISLSFEFFFPSPFTLSPRFFIYIINFVRNLLVLFPLVYFHLFFLLDWISKRNNGNFRGEIVGRVRPRKKRKTHFRRTKENATTRNTMHLLIAKGRLSHRLKPV